VWEIKRISWTGFATGEMALEAYTAPETGLKRGGDLPDLKSGGELSLYLRGAEYKYTNFGGGLIGYERKEVFEDRTPVVIPRILPSVGGRGRGRDDGYGH
jgi:hypothetical protein